MGKEEKMLYCSYYNSPVGNLLLAATKTHLVGVWIENQKYFLDKFEDEIMVSEDTKVLKMTRAWLDQYFSSDRPSIKKLPLAPQGEEFRQRVWNILREIPYGQVVTYKDIANKIKDDTNKAFVSAQAVGNAVGHNPISIIIPCHRVVGSNGSLTGYAGGIENKVKLLEMEKVDMSKLFLPKKQ